MAPEKLDDGDIPSGIDFRDPKGVAKWLETAESARPWRPAIRERIAALVRERCPAPARVLELGPGPGFLAAVILGTCAIESYTLFDHSETFLDMCRERVGGTGLARFVLGDFKQDTDWPSSVAQQAPYHAAITMQAVHELRHKRHAVTLYRQVLPLLVSGGALIVCDSSPKDDARSQALHASVTEQRVAMTEAGFSDVELSLADHGMYICTARR